MLNNSGINKVFLVGHIGKEPRLHTLNEQEQLCFPLVTNEFIKKNGETIEHIEWHQIKIPLNIYQAANCKLAKGNLVYIEGKISTRSFVDDTGIKRYKSEILVNKLELLTGAAMPAIEEQPSEQQSSQQQAFDYPLAS